MKNPLLWLSLFLLLTLCLVLIAALKLRSDRSKEDSHAIFMDLPYEAYFEVMLNGVDLAIVHSRRLIKSILGACARYLYSLFEKLLFARQLSRLSASVYDGVVVSMSP